MLIQRNSESHFYAYCQETGTFTPCYDTPKKTAGGMRAVTLKDAKEKGLCVGISTIANMLPKPALTNWRIEQAIVAAVTLPRKPDESLDEFCLRVVTDAEAQSNKAKEFGTRIHDGIEKILRGVGIDTDLEPWLSGFRKWADEWITNIYGLEQIVGDPALGVAGRLDIQCGLKDIGRTIIDVKTQGVKKAPVFYKEWAIQLSGYRHCLWRELQDQDFQILSLIVDTNALGPAHWCLWPDHDYFAVFQHCLALWIYQNDFNPAQL